MKSKFVALSIVSTVVGVLIFSFQNATVNPGDTLSYYDSRCSSAFTGTDATKIYNAIVSANLTPEVAFTHAMNRLGYGFHSNSTYTVDYISNYKVKYGVAAARQRVADIVVAALKRGSLVDVNAATVLRAQFPILRRTDDGIFQFLQGRYQARDAAKAAGNTALFSQIDVEIAEWRRDVQNLLEAKHYASAILNPDVAVGEVLTDFWFNHFSVNSHKSDTGTFSHENVMRTNICGNFNELLLKSSRSVGMLRFLDNFMSTGKGTHWSGATGLNENFARELLELHTLGTGPTSGIYTQADVREVARVLTGWSMVTDPYPQRLYQIYKFIPAIHATGTKRVMGITYPEGEAAGVTLLQNLSKHAATKSNICRKLGKRFMGKTPTAALVNSCISAWGTIGPLPRLYMAYLGNAEFWSDTNSKIKNPFEVLASAQRLAGAGASQLTATHLRSDLSAVRRFGMLMKGNGAPTGYSENHLEWLSPGYLTNLVTILFKNLQTNLYYRTGANIYSGPYLEAFVGSMVTSSRTTASATTKSKIIKGGHLAFTNSNGELTIINGLVYPDKQGSKPLPLRTTATTMTSSKNFLLK